MAAHAHLKNELMEYEKCHSLIIWLKQPILKSSQQEEFEVWPTFLEILNWAAAWQNH